MILILWNFILSVQSTFTPPSLPIQLHGLSLSQKKSLFQPTLISSEERKAAKPPLKLTELQVEVIQRSCVSLTFDPPAWGEADSGVKDVRYHAHSDQYFDFIIIIS